MQSIDQDIRPSGQVQELAAAVPGESTDEMLHKLLANLAALLGARRAYVTEVVCNGTSRTIASWEDGARGPVREYQVSGTPCASVLRHGVQVFDCELAKRFTLEEGSLGHGCESFIGSPVVDRNNERIGQLCVFGAGPLHDTELASALVSLAAVRVSSELEYRKHEAALARSEAYSAAIVATAAEGIVTLDEEGNVESFNRAAEKMFGYATDELIGKDISVLMPEPHRTRHSEYVGRYVETGVGTVIGKGREVMARRKDGSVFPIHVAASEIDLGDERCFAGIIRDISEQKEAEASLRESEQRFRAVFDQRHQLIAILDPTGIVLETNRSALDFNGLERDDVVGREYWDTPWWQHSEAQQAQVRGAIEAASRGETPRFEANVPRPRDRSATLLFSVRPIFDEFEKIVLLVAESHDITEQKRAQEEARQHRARIAHVSRLSTLGEMAAGIAHEINQPLTAISLFTQAGKRLVESGNFEKMGEICHKLNEHALRAADVVERMQAMARQGENNVEIADCNDLMESAVRLAESEARIHDIEIEFNKSEGLPPVSVDGVQIQQVALNLIRNGMEAMIAHAERRDSTIRVRTWVDEDGNAKVTVTDCGGGISPSRAEKLFTPFSTTKESGMGMGLAISQAIIHAHGGRIDFRNNEADGATFGFTLPAAKREASHVR